MAPGFLGTLACLGTQFALGICRVLDIFHGREEIRHCPCCGTERDAALEAGDGQGKCRECGTFISGAYFGLAQGLQNEIRVDVFRRMRNRPAAFLSVTLNAVPHSAFLALLSQRGGEYSELKMQGARGGKKACNKQSYVFWDPKFIASFCDFGTLGLPSADAGKGLHAFKATKYGDVAFVAGPLTFTHERTGRDTATLLESLTVTFNIGVVNAGGNVDFAPKHPYGDAVGRRQTDLSLAAREALADVAWRGFAAPADVVSAVCSSDKRAADRFCSEVYAEAARLKVVREKTAALAALNNKIQAEQKALMAAKRARK